VTKKGGVSFIDLNSSNGTYYEDKRVKPGHIAILTKGNYFKVGECPCEITFKDVVEKDTFSDTSSSEEEQKPNEVRQHEEKSSESEQSPRKKHSQKHRYNKNKYKREKEKEKEEHDDSNDSPRTRLLKKKKNFPKII